MAEGDDAGSLVSDAEVDIDAHWTGSERHLIGLEQPTVKAPVAARLIVRGSTIKTKKTRAARVLWWNALGTLADISLLSVK